MATDILSLSRDILSTPGLEKATDGLDVGSKPRFYSVSVGHVVVNIESTAFGVTDALFRFSLNDQKQIFEVLLVELSKPGSCLLLREDKFDHNAAYVTRREDSLGGVVNLLFTR